MSSDPVPSRAASARAGVMKPADRKRTRGRPTAAAGPALSDDKLWTLAVQAFAERGYEAVSMRDLARRLGVSHNLLPARFGSKEGLWRAAIEAQIAPSIAAARAVLAAPDLDDAQRLRELVAAFVRWAQAYPEVIGLINQEGRIDSWRLDHLHQHHVQPFQAVLDELLGRIAASTGRPVISGAAFMVLLVHGVGNCYAASPLMQRVQSIGPDGQPHPIDIALITRLLLSTVLGPAEPVR